MTSWHFSLGTQMILRKGLERKSLLPGARIRQSVPLVTGDAACSGEQTACPELIDPRGLADK